MTSAKQAALQLWQAFGARDPEKIRAALTPDALDHSPGNATAIASGANAGDLLSVEGIIGFICGYIYPRLPRRARRLSSRK